MNCASLASRIWHETYVPIFIERFVLPILATAMIAVIILNPLKLDLQQQISLAIAVIAFAYFVAHSVYKKNISRETTAPQTASSRTTAQTSLPRAGAQSTPTAPLVEQIEIKSPDSSRRIRIKNHDGGGLIVSLINDQLGFLEPSNIIATDAASFNSRESSFRVSDGRQIRIASYDRTAGGAIALETGVFAPRPREWVSLLNIVDGRLLELGSHRGFPNAALVWPTGDDSTLEIWLLALLVRSDGLPDWILKLRLEWQRGSKTILFGEAR